MKLASIADKNAETAFLYCLLQDSDLLTSVPEVKPEHFSSARHGALFDAMLACSAAEHSFNIPTLVRFMVETGRLARLTPATEEPFLKIELAGMDPGFRGAKHLRTYANVILRCARNRAVANLVDESVAARNAGDFARVRALAGDIEKASQNGDSRGVSFRTAASLFLSPKRSIPWVIEGLLAEGDIVMLFGPGSTGKSYLLYSLAWSLTTGLPVWGRWTPPRPYRILIFDLEMQEWEREIRSQQLGRGLGFQPAGEHEKAIPLPENLLISGDPLNLDDPHGSEQLRYTVEHEKIDFVILDSFRRFTSGDENSSAVVSGIFNRHLKPLRDRYGCGVIVVDHTRKLTGDPNLDVPEQMARGTGDKRNFVDAQLGAFQRKEGGVLFIPTKTRHSALPDSLVLDVFLSPEECSVTITGNADEVASSIRDAVLVLLQTKGTRISRGEILGRLDYSSRGIDKALAQLVKEGILCTEKTGHERWYWAA